MPGGRDRSCRGLFRAFYGPKSGVAALQLEERFYATLQDGLRGSIAEQEAYCKEQLARLGNAETRLRNSIKQLDLDKLAGDIDRDFYLEVKVEKEAELSKVQEKIAAIHAADKRTIDHGLNLLELAQSAYPLYLQRPNVEKREMLNLLCSNYLMDGGVVTPIYRKPFDLITSTVDMTEK